MDHAGASTYRREVLPALSVSRNPSVPRSVVPPLSQVPQHRGDSPRTDDAAQPRAPPGLSGGVATPPDGSPPRGIREPSSSSPTSRSVGGAPALARTMSTRAGPANSFPGPQVVPKNPSAEVTVPPPSIPPVSSAPPPVVVIPASPPRRDTRTPSPQNATHSGIPSGAMQTPSPTQSSPTSAPSKRNVRWNDNLVCPSPILPEHRRRGWFNRRG